MTNEKRVRTKKRGRKIYILKQVLKRKGKTKLHIKILTIIDMRTYLVNS